MSYYFKVIKAKTVEDLSEQLNAISESVMIDNVSVKYVGNNGENISALVKIIKMGAMH